MLAVIGGLLGGVSGATPQALSTSDASYWSAGEVRPAARGFRPALAGAVNGTATIPAVPSRDTPARSAAAGIIRKRLARDGMLVTLAAVIERLVAEERFRAAPVSELAQVGFPVDWLRHWEVSALDRRNRATLDELLPAHVWQADDDPAALVAVVRSATFAFKPSAPAFRAADESGRSAPAMIRLQATRGTYWQGPGAGGCLDLIRQLHQTLPETQFLVTVQATHLTDYRRTAIGWAQPRAPDGSQILATPMVVSQWAQDNGKAGVLVSDEGVPVRPACLVPRYASRFEDGSVFVPGETYLLQGVAAAGVPVVQSPLLFQGGNMLIVDDPRRGRIMLLGEAEIHRNRALGLSPTEVAAAFRIEFGVDECVVLPAVSFHIDFDVTVRSTEDGNIVALVNDHQAASDAVLVCGIDALERAGALEEAIASQVRAALRVRDYPAALERLMPVLEDNAVGPGRFPESFANLFSVGPVDSGVGNFRCFLMALDLTMNLYSPPQTPPASSHARAYLRSFHRRARDESRLRAILSDLGWQVVAIPSMSEAGRGINYLNGIHTPTRYLMPAYGGLYAPVDRLAKKALAVALGPQVSIVPILTAESQRRVGAIHCSASVFPMALSASD